MNKIIHNNNVSNQVLFYKDNDIQLIKRSLNKNHNQYDIKITKLPELKEHQKTKYFIKTNKAGEGIEITVDSGYEIKETDIYINNKTKLLRVFYYFMNKEEYSTCLFENEEDIEIIKKENK